MKTGSEDNSSRATNGEAADAFVRREVGHWSRDEQNALEERLVSDPRYARAFQGMEKSWRSIGAHAESPELMKLRESAISWARRESRKRWGSAPIRRRGVLAACGGMVALAIAVCIQLSPYGYHPGLYQTGIGQQTRVDLADRSRIELDAATRLQVKFSHSERTIRLFEGQAQFSVASDPARPFTVLAGGQTIVAIGTVFTVEVVDREVRVTTLEGKVAVSPAPNSLETLARHEKRGGEGPVRVPVAAGEALRVGSDGRFELVAKADADLEAATAWLEGNVMFKDEPLSDAVQRLNRYSRLKLKITDPALAKLRVSGVFQKGDAEAFARSVSGYYPVVIDESDGDSIRLRLK